jgi:Rrf2 family nitric oxide-sensitive transcriptional repressor
MTLQGNPLQDVDAMFQQSSEICLRALAVLVAVPSGTVVQSREIGDKLGLSAGYVTKALQPLARKGWLQSVQGRGGGWRLVQDPGSLTIFDVLEVLEPAGSWKRCFMGHPVCSDDPGCPFHSTWSESLARMEATMRQTRLSQLGGLPDDSPWGLPVRQSGGRPR